MTEVFLDHGDGGQDLRLPHCEHLTDAFRKNGVHAPQYAVDDAPLDLCVEEDPVVVGPHGAFILRLVHHLLKVVRDGLGYLVFLQFSEEGWCEIDLLFGAETLKKLEKATYSEQVFL